MVKDGLSVFDLRTEKDRDRFRAIRSEFGSFNPFHSLEYILGPKGRNDSLKYFVFFKNDSPEVLLPYFLRPILISGESTGYFDVISPYGYSGPILKDNSDDSIIKSFWEAVDSWYQKNSILSEFVRFSPNNNHLNYTGHVVQSLLNVRGRIIDEPTQWHNFKKKVRNNVRKALKHNLTAKILKGNIDLENIKDFHKIYIRTLKRKEAHDRYYYDLDYFIDFTSYLKDYVAMVFINHNGKPISTELLILWKDTIYSYLGGTEEAFFKYRPNDLLKLVVLNWGRKLGYSYYNLGGGQLNNDSLYNYKKSFFPLDEDLPYYTGRKVIDDKVYCKMCRIKKNIIISKDFNLTDNNEFFPLYRVDEGLD